MKDAMASFQIRPSKKIQGLIIRALILIIFIFASYFLIMRLISQFYYLKAMNHVPEGYYLPAAQDLEKAIYFQPDYPVAWRELGRAYGNLADLYPEAEAFPMAKKSKQACSKAAALSPLDGQSAFGLAVAEARLEFLYAHLHPDRLFDILGIKMFDSAEIRIHPTGKALARFGTKSQGQGHETTFSQVVADTFGLPIENVVIVQGDDSWKFTFSTRRLE